MQIAWVKGCVSQQPEGDSMRARRVLFAVAVGVLCAAGADPALALGIPGYTLSLSSGGETFQLSDLPVSWTAAPPNGGTYQLQNAVTDPLNNFTVNSWSSQVDVDPFVTNNLNVTNISAFTQTFDVTVTLPIAPQTPATQMQGSVGITLTNTTGTASLTDAGTAIYTALIDGSPVQTLRNPAYTLSCTPPFCSISDNTDFGIPTPIAGPAALSTIAIRLHFTLSPGDSAGLTSVFNITAVPEPMTVLMVGLGLLGLGVAGRSRA